MKTVLRELDERDKEIIGFLCEGMTAKEIAYEMKISSHTVAARVREMKRYYGCKNITELVLKLNECC